MPIAFNCPHCQSPIRVSDEHAGKTGKCPKCNEPVTVPLEQAPVAEPLAVSLDFDDEPGAPPADSHSSPDSEIDDDDEDYEDEDDDEDDSAYAPRERHTGRLIVICVGLLILVAGGFGGYVMWDDAKTMEIYQAWERAKAENTVGSYSAFLRRFADSHNASEAAKGLASLETPLDLETLDLLETHLEAFPNTTHSGVVRQRHERDLWLIANREHSESLLQEYLKIHPTGAHSDAAMKELDGFAWARALEDNTVASYDLYLATTNATHAGEAKTRRDDLAQQQEEQLRRGRGKASALAGAKAAIESYLQAQMDGLDGKEFWVKDSVIDMYVRFHNINSYKFSSGGWEGGEGDDLDIVRATVQIDGNTKGGSPFKTWYHVYTNRVDTRWYVSIVTERE